MLMKKLTSYFPVIKNYIERNFPQVFCSIIILIVIVLTFKLQNRVVGWEPGYDDLQPKHHGWVSAHTLAIISRATAENGFVGYTLALKDEQNNIHYEYFDRYPIFFSALFNKVLSLRSQMSGQIYLARQVMNLIFLSTMIVAFLIIDKLIRNKPLALTAALLAFSNPYLLFYKDMIHFDQPALFGFLLLIYAIALYKLDGLKFPLYISTFVAVGLGRGYASFAVLLLWFAIEAFMILRSKDLIPGEKFKNMLKHPSVFVLVAGILWGASLLSYNVLVEAHKLNVSIWETSIINSAEKRLSLSETFNEENMEIINWPGFILGQSGRIVKWSFPVKVSGFTDFETVLFLILMFFLMGRIICLQTVEKRTIYLLLLLSGFVWILPLRNLAAFHDYTTMYYIGVPLVFFVSIFTILNPSKSVTYYLVIAGLVVYTIAIIQVKDWHEQRAGNANTFTYDFMRIREKIDGTGKNIYVASPIPYGPYPAGYYLSGQYLTPLQLADYVVSRKRNYLPNNLTPENKLIFLFKNEPVPLK